MWSPMAAEAREGPHRRRARPARHGPVLAPPPAATNKWTAGRRQSAPSSTKLGIDRADIVAHDNRHDGRVCLTPARYPDKTSRLVLIDSPIPGIPPWEPESCALPALWHFKLRRPGRRAGPGSPVGERIYLDRFLERIRWRPDEDRRSDPPPLRRDLRQARRDGIPRSPSSSRSARKDEADNPQGRWRRSWRLPVLAIGAEKAFGAKPWRVVMRNAATKRAGIRRAERRPLG